jgi:hypothetical protein
MYATRLVRASSVHDEEFSCEEYKHIKIKDK